MENALQVMPSKPISSLNSPTRILNSWKEISVYLGRGVRTVQRYEEQLKLPVHRLGEQNRSRSVVAFSDEIDLWLRSTATKSSIASTQSSKDFDSDLEEAGKALEKAYAAYQATLRRYTELKIASVPLRDSK